MLIMFIGTNPSHLSKDNIPFKDVKSGITLSKWVEYLGIIDVVYINISDEKTPNNKPIKNIKSYLDSLKYKIDTHEPDKIISLGKIADNALNRLKINHFSAEHPSGLNRKLNDKEYVFEMLENMKRYIKKSPG